MNPGPTRRSRGQSEVVGVALLLGLAVLSLGILTAAIGAVVEDNAASADARRVAQDLDDALAPVEATGPHRGRVSFVEGRLATVERELRLLDDDGVVSRIAVDGLVFESEDRRAAFVAGAVVRGSPGNAVLVAPPPVAASADGDVLVVGAPRLNGTAAVAGSEVSATLLTDVTHDRTDLGTDTFRVAIETATPGPFERYLRRRGATVDRRDLDGDGVPSVVARFPGDRVGYLVVHDLHLEVGHA